MEHAPRCVFSSAAFSQRVAGLSLLSAMLPCLYCPAMQGMDLVSMFSADFGVDPRSQDSILTKRGSVLLVLLFTHPSLKKDGEKTHLVPICATVRCLEMVLAALGRC